MKVFLAELVATYFMVLIGTGAIIMSDETSFVGNFEISVAFGLAVTVMILIFGKTSGAHMNPAVSISMAIEKQLDKKVLGIYLLAQIIGALLSSITLKMIRPHHLTLGATHSSGTNFQAFVIEFFITMFLMSTIYLTAFSKTKLKNLAPYAIGFAVFLGAFFAGPYCGASMNPARSIGPAVMSYELHDLWVYISAPILGAVCAGFLCRKQFRSN